MDLVERLFSVNLGLAGPEELEVRPGQDEKSQKPAPIGLFVTYGQGVRKLTFVLTMARGAQTGLQMLAALGARWQPFGATHIYEKLPGMPLDPSAVKR